MIPEVGISVEKYKNLFQDVQQTSELSITLALPEWENCMVSENNYNDGIDVVERIFKLGQITLGLPYIIFAPLRLLRRKPQNFGQQRSRKIS